MLAVAFEGCACRAAFHAGVAAALVEARLPIQLTAGTSSGSIIAAAVAAGHGATLPERWLALADRPIVSWRRVLWNRSPFDMSHLVSTTLREALGGVDLRARPVEAIAVATRVAGLLDAARGPAVEFSSREEADMVPPLLASCFLPVLYGRPVRIGGELYVDGGVVDNLPIERCVARGADEVIAVVTRPDGTAFKSARVRRWRPSLRGARLHVVHPRAPLALRSWEFTRDPMRRAIDEGYAVGRQFAA